MARGPEGGPSAPLGRPRLTCLACVLAIMRRCSVPALVGAVVTRVGVDVARRVAVQAEPSSGVLERDGAVAGADSLPALVGPAVTGESVDVPGGVAVQAKSGREVGQAYAAPVPGGSPELVAAAVTRESVHIVCGVAVEAESC